MTIKKQYLLIIFIFLAIAQLCVPFYMACRWENVLRNGTPFYWTIEPIDPYDPFRGKYISLRFQQTSGPVAADSLGLLFNNYPVLSSPKTVYAILGTNTAGEAVIQEVSLHKPSDKQYVKAKFSYKDKNSSVHVSLPFNRYYLPEELAPKAEQEMIRQARDKKYAVALVRIKDGYGVIEDIYFDGKKFIEYLREESP